MIPVWWDGGGQLIRSQHVDILHHGAIGPRPEESRVSAAAALQTVGRLLRAEELTAFAIENHSNYD